MAPNVACFSQRHRAGQADAKQDGGWFLLRSQGINPHISRSREPDWFLQLHAGHKSTKETLRLFGRAAGRLGQVMCAAWCVLQPKQLCHQARAKPQIF